MTTKPHSNLDLTPAADLRTAMRRAVQHIESDNYGMALAALKEEL